MEIHRATGIRLEDDAVRFVRAFAIKGKPIAAICDGPALLIEAGILPGRQVTSFPSSRKPDDIPAFNERMIENLRKLHIRK